jgi:5'-nucleotidase
VILITNDDGYEAAGIKSLAEACSKQLGEVIVFAPDGPRSGMSAAITCDRPIRCRMISERQGLTVYSCSGTPTDCVKLAINEILPSKPRLLLSGVNHGGNQALSVHYSGTMGAAFEGAVFDVPSIGVSLYNYKEDADFSNACRIAVEVAKKVLCDGLPHGTYLNLNVPNISDVKGIRMARQTPGKWVREFLKETLPDGELVYHLTGEYEPSGKDRPDNDLNVLNNGYAAIVPCRIDITDYELLNVYSL